MTSIVEGNARLGESAEQFTSLFGRPLYVQLALGGVLQRYRVNDQEVAAFFHRGQAVAVHVSYPRDGAANGSRLRPADFLPIETPERDRILVSDSGWVVATPSCPLSITRLAAGLP